MHSFFEGMQHRKMLDGDESGEGGSRKPPNSLMLYASPSFGGMQHRNSLMFMHPFFEGMQHRKMLDGDGSGGGRSRRSLQLLDGLCIPFFWGYATPDPEMLDGDGSGEGGTRKPRNSFMVYASPSFGGMQHQRTLDGDGSGGGGSRRSLQLLDGLCIPFLRVCNTGRCWMVLLRNDVKGCAYGHLSTPYLWK